MSILSNIHLKFGKVTICIIIVLIGIILLIVGFARKSKHKHHTAYIIFGVIFILLSIGLFYMFHPHQGDNKLADDRFNAIKDGMSQAIPKLSGKLSGMMKRMM